jgi:hypothetical protein
MKPERKNERPNANHAAARYRLPQATAALSGGGKGGAGQVSETKEALSDDYSAH